MVVYSKTFPSAATSLGMDGIEVLPHEAADVVARIKALAPVLSGDCRPWAGALHGTAPRIKWRGTTVDPRRLLAAAVRPGVIVNPRHPVEQSCGEAPCLAAAHLTIRCTVPLTLFTGLPQAGGDRITPPPRQGNHKTAGQRGVLSVSVGPSGKVAA